MADKGNPYMSFLTRQGRQAARRPSTINTNPFPSSFSSSSRIPPTDRGLGFTTHQINTFAQPPLSKLRSTQPQQSSAGAMGNTQSKSAGTPTNVDAATSRGKKRPFLTAGTEGLPQKRARRAEVQEEGYEMVEGNDEAEPDTDGQAPETAEQIQAGKKRQSHYAVPPLPPGSETTRQTFALPKPEPEKKEDPDFPIWFGNLPTSLEEIRMRPREEMIWDICTTNRDNKKVVAEWEKMTGEKVKPWWVAWRFYETLHEMARHGNLHTALPDDFWTRCYPEWREQYYLMRISKRVVEDKRVHQLKQDLEKKLDKILWRHIAWRYEEIYDESVSAGKLRWRWTAKHESEEAADALVAQGKVKIGKVHPGNIRDASDSELESDLLSRDTLASESSFDSEDRYDSEQNRQTKPERLRIARRLADSTDEETDPDEENDADVEEEDEESEQDEEEGGEEQAEDWEAEEEEGQGDGESPQED